MARTTALRRGRSEKSNPDAMAAMTIPCAVALVLLLGWAPPSVAGNIRGKITLQGWRENGDAVVYIEKIPSRSFPAPTAHAKMDQKNLTFIPHVLPVLTGTTVDYFNSDTVLHNVFSPDVCADECDLGTWPRGKVRSHTFTHPGCEAVILCNVHPEMEAYVVVLETPYYAVTGKDGSYVIGGIPEGTYTVSIWHEGMKRVSRPVSVPASGSVSLNVTVRE